MGWRDLLSSAKVILIYPWTGGRRLRVDEMAWALVRETPKEHAWTRFACNNNRTAVFDGPADPNLGSLKFITTGYLVGNRLVPDHARVDGNPLKIAEQTEEVFLIEPGLDRFVRVSAGRTFEDGPLIFKNQEFPLGPETEVLNAFLEQKTITAVKGVSPALDAAYWMEVWQRQLAWRRREENERRLREEAEKREKEERRQKLVEQLGDGHGRRTMAQIDFGEAARAALAIGGAVYLDHRTATRKHEMVVKFRLENRRFECVCDDRTMRIIDAGICLNAHYDDDEFEEGTKGDSFFTLESLPMVIQQAQRERKLVVFRHVD
jgi:hypothetical protein